MDVVEDYELQEVENTSFEEGRVGYTMDSTEGITRNQMGWRDGRAASDCAQSDGWGGWLEGCARN